MTMTVFIVIIIIIIIIIIYYLLYAESLHLYTGRNHVSGVYSVAAIL